MSVFVYCFQNLWSGKFWQYVPTVLAKQCGAKMTAKTTGTLRFLKKGVCLVFVYYCGNPWQLSQLAFIIFYTYSNPKEKYVGRNPDTTFVWMRVYSGILDPASSCFSRQDIDGKVIREFLIFMEVVFILGPAFYYKYSKRGYHLATGGRRILFIPVKLAIL